MASPHRRENEGARLMKAIILIWRSLLVAQLPSHLAARGRDCCALPD